jgi:SPP1 gp7 family putative phage head morphogenesis protein
MKNANTDYYDKAVDRAAMVRLYEKRTTDQIELILDGHRVRLDDLMRKGNLTTKGRKQLLQEIDEELRKTYQETYRASKKNLLDLFKDQISYAYQNVEASVGKIWRAERPSNRVAEEFIINKPLIENRTLLAGWAGVSLNERSRIEATIRSGLAENLTINEIARNVRKGNVHNISYNQSRALVVTGITSVVAQADHAVYMSNEKSLNGWQYVAVLDSRTTALCAHRDGTIYPVSDTHHLPPAHFNCRSTTIPIFKSWEDMANLEGVAQVRRKNLEKLTEEQKAYYDGLTPMKESYHEWLYRQPTYTQLKHLGDYKKVHLFQTGKLHLDKFTNDEGRSLGIRELRAMSDSGYNVPSTSKRFAAAKERLDAMQLYATTPDDFINDAKLRQTLKDYYILQSGDLDGLLSLTNYRGVLPHVKRGMKRRILTSPPTEDQMRFNPVTGRYEDTRLYQPNPAILSNSLRLMRESEDLLKRDKEFIEKFSSVMRDHVGINETAVIVDNLRNIFARQRRSGEIWGNFKAISNSQLSYDLKNVSSSIETNIRSDSDVLKRLLESNYIDPVLGNTQLEDLSKNLIPNILKRNRWENKIAPKIASELQSFMDVDLLKKHPILWNRISPVEMNKFYLRFAHRLAVSETPDRDQLAVSLGRDLYNMANINGDRNAWFELGKSILEHPKASKLYEIETFGVQKRRIRSRMSGQYFGPYYDTMSYNIRIVDPRIQEYSQLTRKIELGIRVPVIEPDRRMKIRPGYKTYFVDRGILGWEDTRIPITSSDSFHDFPVEFIDKDFAKAMNWTGSAEYKIDPEFYDFVNKLIYFQDDRGKAKHYNEVNEFRKYIAARGDTYERFKAMEWLRKNDYSFSNNVFIDHRGRVYERGLIGPQAGETFRPFLNTKEMKILGVEGFQNLQDQIGAFLGGLDDYFEGRYNSLTFKGRQGVAEKWRPELVRVGNHILRGKPADIRAVLDSDIVSRIDGDELAKFLRLAMEAAKIDTYLSEFDRARPYRIENLRNLEKYMTSLALEQDASASGAQIIALTTRNKQLAEFSNVIPTDQKKRIYDEVASATFNDPRFRKINERLGVTEKDLRNASKYQVMVSLYGAGERTGILQVEKNLAKVLSKQDDVLVVNTSDRDQVLSEISARIAKVQRYDEDTANELKNLRKNVKDIFDKGLSVGEEIIEDLWFLDSTTRDLVERMSQDYEKRITPQDFKQVANIMSEHMADRVPILKDFTRYFGRLAEDYLKTSKPSKADFDWKSIMKIKTLGYRDGGYILPENLSRMMGLKPNEPVREKVLKRFGFWNPGGNLADMVYGVPEPHKTKAGERTDARKFTRRTGGKYFKLGFSYPRPKVTFKEALDTVFLRDMIKKPEISLVGEKKLHELELFYANKMPSRWTNIPFVNFDGKVLEQNYTQVWEQRLTYQDDEGNWYTNILQVPQKTETTWWDALLNKQGKINDIADATRARTAYGVNANHSNDATLVKQFHLWGADNNVPTSTVHDAFFTNIADMMKARTALRNIYARAMEKNVIKLTLDEMRSRGMPKELYDKYLNEAIELGLIPVVGRSRVGGRLLQDTDILKREDILKEIPPWFKDNFGWYGVG